VRLNLVILTPTVLYCTDCKVDGPLRNCLNYS
jgi:hypothetical protein